MKVSGSSARGRPRPPGRPGEQRQGGAGVASSTIDRSASRRAARVPGGSRSRPRRPRARRHTSPGQSAIEQAEVAFCGRPRARPGRPGSIGTPPSRPRDQRGAVAGDAGSSTSMPAARASPRPAPASRPPRAASQERDRPVVRDDRAVEAPSSRSSLVSSHRRPHRNPVDVGVGLHHRPAPPRSAISKAARPRRELAAADGHRRRLRAAREAEYPAKCLSVAMNAGRLQARARTPCRPNRPGRDPRPSSPHRPQRASRITSSTGDRPW